VIEAAKRFSKPYRVTNGRKFRLTDVDSGDTGELRSEDKPRVKEALQNRCAGPGGVAGRSLREELLVGAPDLLGNGRGGEGWPHQTRYVRRKSAGRQVTSFKTPTSEDLDHDYLWRCVNSLPERGRIGIFNRSYYQETLVVRVQSVRRFADRLVGSPEIYAHKEREAERSVNFVACHDGFTLDDLVSNQNNIEANGENNRDRENDNRSWNCGSRRARVELAGVVGDARLEISP
jgi:hypothetical protein